MCKVLVTVYFLTRLLSNVNCLFVDKSSFTHLDRLYFKHNKRHKFALDKILCLCYIHPCIIKTQQKNLHIQGVKSESCDPTEGVGWNPVTRIPSFLRATGEDSDETENPKDRSAKIEPQRSGSRTHLKNKKGNSDSQAKNSPSGQNSPPKWMFRGKENVTDKISEYESLMSEIEDLSKSEDRTDKDLYSLIQKNLKETSTDPDVKVTTRDILRSLDTQAMAEDLQEREWIKHIKRVRSKLITKLDSVEKIPKLSNPLEVNLKAKAKEDACGFRYPIEGSPDEIFTEEDDYKFWGRTPLSASESTHPKPDSRGKILKKERELEDIIQSMSARDQKEQDDYLKGLRESKFKTKMDNILNWTKYKKVNKEYEDKERTNAYSEEANRYKNVEFENYYESFKRDFLNSDPESQEYVLKALNKYNPWDEYIKMKNLKSSLPQIGLNYKLNLNDLKVSFNSVEAVSQSEITTFLREYLHYFLILESDRIMFEEFKKSKFLYDILKYFDLNEELEEEKVKEFMDVTDRMFKHYFPKECQQGFPKRPPEAEFPITIEKNRGIMALNDKLTGRTNSYHRVNMVSCLLALAKCHPLVREYSEDIFTEQRIKMMLETMERGLALELQRLEYGISEIQVTNLKNNSLCKVDGTFLKSLTEILLQWNIKHGIENILDLVLLITLRSMEEWEPSSLVRIIRNISYLTTLPDSVYLNFLSKVVDFIHEQLKLSLLNKTKYMELEEGLEFLTLISRYEGMVTREFMEAFIQVYREEILNLRAEMEEMEGLNSKLGGSSEADASEVMEKLGKRKEQTLGLISCLQLAGLKEYIQLLEDVTKGMIMQNFDMNSMGLISVLETFNEKEEFQRRLITKSKNSLMKKKYAMDPGRVVKALEAFTRGVRENRLEPDSHFFCTMMKQFCFLKGPNSEELVKSAQLTDEFAPYLSRKEITTIFEDLTNTPVYYNFLTRIGLRGEFLEYPIRTVAKVLYYSAKNKVVLEKNWKTFYEMIKIFKHILSIEDITIILDAMIAARFTKADELLEVLCRRVCNLIEITDVEPEKVLEIMNKCLELDHVPINLLRFYTYCNMFEIQGSDHVESLLGDRKDYDIDFRGWKRPRSFDSHTEPVRLHLNVFPEVKMRGSRAEVPENLKYSMQPPLKKIGHFDQVARKEVDKGILRSLAEFVDRVGSYYKFSEKDRNLINSLVEMVKG